MANKRVPIYIDDLSHHIKIVEDRLFENARKLTGIIREHSKQMDPPFPSVFSLEDMLNEYHTATLAAVTFSSVMKLHQELKSISPDKITKAIQEYVNLPSRLSGKQGHQQPGVQDTSFPEDSFGIFDEIADYLELHDFDVPYLKRSGATSYKVVACIAIIYAGRELKANESTKQSGNASN